MLEVGGEFHVIFFQAFADAGEGFVHRVVELQHFIFFLIDHAPAHHGAEVQDFVPIFAAVDDDEIVAWQLSGLQQREHLPQ